MSRWLRRAGILVAGLLALLAGLLLLADTDIGHRLIAERIAAQSPKSGLRIRIGRIDGSIYGKASLKDVRLSDPQGVFFSAPAIALDWTPMNWVSNTLDIDALTAKTATLLRKPALRPGDPNQPILPGFDIRIGRLEINRLTIAHGVAGKAQTGRVAGRADIRKGRALIALDVDAAEGDRARVLLDAEPDRDRFDLDAELKAPAGGVLASLIGTTRPITAQIKGDGRWTAWKGTFATDVSGTPVARIGLAADAGRFTGMGSLSVQNITKGKLQRLTAPTVKVRAEGTFANRRIDGRLVLASAAMVLDGKGGIDLSSNAYRAVRIDGRLTDHKALFPNMGGQPVDLAVRLDGPFAGAWFDYLLATPMVNFDRTGFEAVRVSGQGRLSKVPILVPMRLTARRVTGLGDVAGGILANLVVEGPLRLSRTLVTGDGLRLTSDKLTGKLNILIDLTTGRYDVGLAGALQRYLIPGLGLVDVKSSLRVVPGPDGRGSRVIGEGQAWVRRFDNAFLAGLAGGLPMLETGLERGPDGILHFRNLRIRAPALSFAGSGYRRTDGSFVIDGRGQQRTYGPFTLSLDGPIARPRMTIVLARPNDAMALRDVRLRLDPVDQGFAFTAAGGSRIGPFTMQGGIGLPKGSAAAIRISDFNASGLRANGLIVPRAGALDGTLALSGNGITGTLLLSPQGAAQRIEAHLTARDADLAGPPRIAARRGKLDGVFLIRDGSITSDATMTGEGLAYGGITLARLAANVRLTNGIGEVRASFAGSRGRIFDLQTVAQVSPDAITLVGSGSIDRKPIRLTSPARLTREAGGWRLAPASLEFAGGQARLSGVFGGASPEISADVTRMPMTILDIVYPRLGLNGVASGTLSYRFPAQGAASGKADMTIRGLARSGLVLTSQPMDVAVSAVLGGTSAGARMVAQSGGQTLGRAQMRLSGIPAQGALPTRLANAALLAQLRFNGSAGTLWRLTGIESFDLSGPVAIGADIGGTLAAPRIQGSLRTTNARIESAVTGMVLTNVSATGRFGGSELVVDHFSAEAGKGGRVTGTGRFDLAARSGFGMNIDMQASKARVLARDDMGATVTGPITIRSDGAGGTIAGDLLLDASSFRLGRATAATAIPQLAVREINTRTPVTAASRLPLPWALAIKARAPNRLSVTGLGLESEWRADLDLGGTVYAPAIKGRADLLRGGYEFAGRRFDLSRGAIRFNGESPPDPSLDIVANGDTEGLSATIRVTGTGLKPAIAFSSTPALPEDELLSRLLFGTSITNLSAPEAVQLAAAVASLRGGGGLDPVNKLRTAIGLDRLRILPADAATGQGTSIAIGKYLTRRAFVEIISDGQGYSATRAEFQITRWLSLLSSISTIGRQSVQVKVSRDY